MTLREFLGLDAPALKSPAPEPFLLDLDAAPPSSLRLRPVTCPEIALYMEFAGLCDAGAEIAWKGNAHD